MFVVGPENFVDDGERKYCAGCRPRIGSYVVWKFDDDGIFVRLFTTNKILFFIMCQEWWTDLWLKEGYATWMEYFFVNEGYPDFDIWTQFVNFETLRAMNLDALKNSHPIEVLYYFFV